MLLTTAQKVISFIVFLAIYLLYLSLVNEIKEIINERTEKEFK